MAFPKTGNEVIIFYFESASSVQVKLTLKQHNDCNV